MPFLRMRGGPMVGLNQVLKGKYRVSALIGRGGMSAVYKARDLELGKDWAVKVIDPSRPEYRRLLGQDGTLAEIEILKFLDHPLAPRLVDRFEEDGLLFLVMDLIEGENLQSVVNRLGAVSPETAVSWMRDLCSLLSYLHENGIVCRDIKPANLILCPDGHVKLVDFGFPTKIVRGKNNSDEEAFGTPGYAAPEQFKHISDSRSDIYSAGMTLYRLLTAADPAKKGFKPRPLTGVRPGLSPGLAAVVDKAVKKDPEKRFQSAALMLDALENYRKAEKPYIEKLRLKLAASRALLAAGLSLFILGGLAAEGFYLKDLASYRELTGSEGGPPPAEEDLFCAIELMPYKTEAYEALIANYRADGLLEPEFSRLEELYEEYAGWPFSFGEARWQLNYRMAEAYIASAPEGPGSVLERALKVSPYLKRASAGRDSGSLASAYLTLSGLADPEAPLPDSASLSAEASAAMNLARSAGLFIGKDSSASIIAAETAVLEYLCERWPVLKDSGASAYAKTLLSLAEESLAPLCEYADPALSAPAAELLEKARALISEGKEAEP